MSEIIEPLAFNCAYPNSPCSYAHECRQIRHCEYIRTDIKDKRQENERKQKEALASQPLCGDTCFPGWMCSRPKGHSGNHEAAYWLGGQVEHSWSQEKGGE